jgi:hypothetical protein
MSVLLALAALSLGWLTLGLLRVKLRSAERWPAAFAAGTPLLAAFVLLLVKLHQYRRGVLVGAAAVMILLALWRRRSLPVEESEPLPRPLLALFTLVLLASFAWTVYAALGPDTTPPGQDSTFAAAAEIHRGAGKPRWNATALWSAAFHLRRYTGVPLFHAFYLPALALALLALLRRCTTPPAAVLAALLLATAPAYSILASQGGTHLLWLFCLFGTLWLAVLSRQSRQWRLLLPALLLAIFTLKLTPPEGAAFGGYIFGWFPWLAALPLAALLGCALQRQIPWLAALLAFQLAASAPALSPRPQPTVRDFGNLLEEALPPASLTLTEQPIARAWTTRRVTTDPALFRIAAMAFDDKLRPKMERRLALTATPRRTFFLEHDGLIAEVRFFRNGVELPRSPAWRVRRFDGETAAPLAFDNSFVTGCDCAIEIDFGAPVEFDEVWIAGNKGQFAGAPKGLRRASTMELKRRGITHILAWEGSPLTDELSRNAPYWGVTEAGSRHGAHLFSLD